MRRILASLLLALVGFSLIAPALFASDADAKLPACCRRNGKHHCTQTTGSGFHAARCADFPSIAAIPSNQTAALPELFEATFAALIAQPTRTSRLEVRSLISYSQAGQKRGPPSFTS